MNSKASSKKGKKQGAQIQEQVIHKIVNFILTHLKLMGIIVLAIIVLIALIMGWIFYQKRLNEKALALESEAFQLYETVSSENTATESGTTAHSYQDVLNAYLKIFEEYSGTESAQRALYLCGSLAYQMGNYDEAQKYFTEYIKKYPKGTLSLYAKESLGYSFEQKGEYQKALENFESIKDKAASSKSSEILLAIARNYEHLENTEAATETYQKIIDSDTASSWKKLAMERLSILQRGGHFPPKTSEEKSKAQTSIPIEAEESAPQPELTPEAEPPAERSPQSEVSPVTEAESTPQP